MSILTVEQYARMNELYEKAVSNYLNKSDFSACDWLDEEESLELSDLINTDCGDKNMINLIRSEAVTPTETHFEVEINGKIIQFAKWIDSDWITDYEFIKGQDELTEDEEEEVVEFINEQLI